MDGADGRDFRDPGTGKTGDLPPRPECTPLWHDRIPATLKAVLKDFKSHGAGFFPLPHPSWRSGIWTKRNPWLETDVLPALRTAVRKALSPR